MDPFRIIWNYFGIHDILAILDFTEVWLMNFSLLKGFHSKWQDILVFGKTTEWNGKKYHIVGMGSPMNSDNYGMIQLFSI